MTLNGRLFHVVGTAVDAALPAFPSVGAFESRRGDNHPGLAWVSQGDAANLATREEPLSYLVNLELTDPQTAASFVSAHQPAAPGTVALASWQQVEQIDQNATKEVRAVLQTAALLLALLAAASVAVLVGGRLTEQTRRVGLLKAVGGTPLLVLGILATEYLILALIAAASGLAIGLVVAPALTNPGVGLLGLTSSPGLSVVGAAIVLTTALAVALVAALVPTWQAARVATLAALADAAHTPRRRGPFIAASSWLPTALLIGLRLASRRIRRSSLAACAAAIAVAALVAVLAAHLRLDHVDNGVPDPRTVLLNQVFVALTATLAVLVAVNIIFITWSTATDARRSLAITRALGAPPRQVVAGLLTAQILPAIPGCLIGIPAGLGLYDVARGDTPMVIPATWQLAFVAAAALTAIAMIAAVPALIGTRRSIIEGLQSDS